MNCDIITYSDFPRCLAVTAPEFARENNDLFLNANELPHAILMQFVPFFVGLFQRSQHGLDSSTSYNVVSGVLRLLNSALGSPDKKLIELIRVSFIEQLADLAPEILDRLASTGGGRLEDEILAEKTSRIAYTTVYIIKEVFGAEAPSNLSSMLDNPLFSHRIHAEGITPKAGQIMDAWDHPLFYEIRSLPDSGVRLHCVCSRGTLHGGEHDVVACLPVV
jgi:hypothetical protein